MDILKIPQIFSASSGISGSAQLIEQLCKNIVNIDPSLPEYQQRKEQIKNVFEQINNFKDQLQSLLG